MTDRRNLLHYMDRGFLQNLIMRGKLILRLMGDRRVNFLFKLLPVGALIYLVSPIDLIPDLVIPGIGVLDDAAVLWLGVTLFVNLCPEDIVQEHMRELQKGLAGTYQPASEQDDGSDVIDVEAHEVPKDEQ